MYMELIFKLPLYRQINIYPSEIASNTYRKNLFIHRFCKIFSFSKRFSSTVLTAVLIEIVDQLGVGIP